MLPPPRHRAGIFHTVFRHGRSAGTETVILVLSSKATVGRRCQCIIFSASVMAHYDIWEIRTILGTSSQCIRYLSSLSGYHL